MKSHRTTLKRVRRALKRQGLNDEADKYRLPAGTHRALCDSLKKFGRCPTCDAPLPKVEDDGEVVLECWECGWSDADIGVFTDCRLLGGPLFSEE